MYMYYKSKQNGAPCWN